ncbi:acyl-CoA dehydrogenase family protein [Parvibaculum sp.]|jgi:alkylation response protein AidB-like acyl-CoA dehydrogenase|uniref:acyl-CoA dehydrogenase family protein n=1 Tax=Parvibaculum sp. TaxID=2024848 RepID=UPI000C54F259|nr:acyl-CoA dehydrogenase family protein [Parvibaculum sp.]HAC59429.1 acyl-CoA dehydrogenase [Rhodobiaceae bacterium]MAU62295.1 acyl-CoA dehydrogenase [Parvibaculum sp.]MBO6667162.1 acyl-CoA dehydrogenase family protein [Parvibaculum sp.]MBO6690845.1 acyl-CoA dehydrogenase family protein [Parvibaculum sp.]MBO6713715.1 acyl-CoA dehydrogenase family protein [Parvibaculum sp.]|tara:strand:+ start:195 stop:1346 length:1152 start_codon:yes stop_codon:yes gene_type:complete
MQPFRFDLCELPGETEGLRQEIRAFLAEELKQVPKVTRAQTWSGSDPEFSRKMGAKGWIGMTWPKEYGGHERSFFDRYVMLEEMLAAGAPVGAHWIGDRQSGPLLLRFGTEEQRQKILPRVAKGECYFCIGMSEPDSGSDLAATRTRAEKVDGGYKVNGTKLWTSGAHHAHYMIALFRTDFSPEAKHSGLTQFLVDLKNTDGITIRPIKDLAGNAHFNEVVFEDAFVPDNMLVGKEGSGWGQVTAELAFERSGPERYLSSFLLMVEMIRELENRGGQEGASEIGRLVAHLVTLRQMSLSVAGMLEKGENPALEASVVKDLGAIFEQDMPVRAHELLGIAPTVGGGSDFEEVLGYLTQTVPSFSLRGGTREILRGIIARGLGLR